MENLKIHVYEAGKAKPETIITIPIQILHIAQKLIPKKIRLSLEKEGIDISGLTELATKKGPKGVLIEIETPKEKLVIALE